MDAFSYARASDPDNAIQLVQRPGSYFIGGGTNLLDLAKAGVVHPLHIVDLNHIGLAGIDELPGGGLRVGAMARNSDVAAHPLVRERYPLLSQALLAGASPQLRNMATVGGNLLQRTRCPYFTDPGFEHCNKRAPASGCAAREGYSRVHAVLGASEACIAVNPSDMSVALAALDATVVTAGRRANRRIPIGDFHRLPGDTPQRDTALEPGELITAVELPPPRFQKHAIYLKVRDRASYAFALVSVAAALELDGRQVRATSIALGGVAHKPWRVPAAESTLIGAPLDEDRNARVAAAIMAGARPYKDNAFKVVLAQRAIVQALRRAGDMS
ncbi:MAG: xanthine dehydrogenase family protein subunit M [Pseudomonadota bacterium]